MTVPAATENVRSSTARRLPNDFDRWVTLITAPSLRRRLSRLRQACVTTVKLAVEPPDSVESGGMYTR